MKRNLASRLALVAALCATLVGARAAHATHFPEGNATYLNQLSPGVPVTDAITYNTSPQNGYDFWVIDVTAGVEVEITATRTGGDLLPNLHVFDSVGPDGTSVNDLGTLLASTGQSSSGTVTVKFTPTTSGLKTVVVSTWTGQSGTYSLVATGITAPHIDAEIDVRPGGGDGRNPINLKSKGVLPVAILSTEEFDALSIDPSTVLIGDPELVGGEVNAVSPLRSSFEDVNGDGLLDLVLHFSIPALVKAGAIGPNSTELAIEALTYDDQLVHGEDSIVIVPKG